MKGETMKSAWNKLSFWLVILPLAAIWSIAPLGVMLSKADGAEMPKLIRFGMYPADDTESLLRKSQPFFRILEKKMGIKVKGFVAHDYAALVEALRSNKLEGAFLGPFGFVLGRELAPISAVVVPVFSGGRVSYKSAIVTRSDSTIKTMEDLRKRTFAFADPGSTSGNLIPRYLMKKLNIIPERDFKTAIYSGSHGATLLAIKYGKVDAGALNYDHVKRAIKSGLLKKGEFRVIKFSAPIPSSLVAVRTNLPKAFQEKFKKAFLSMPQGNIGNWVGIEGFRETNDAAYDELADIAKEMNMNAVDVLKKKKKKKSAKKK